MIRGQGRIETDEQKTWISLLKTENSGGDGRGRRAREKDHDPRVLEGILGIMARKEEGLIGIIGTDYTAYEIHNQTSQHTIGKGPCRMYVKLVTLRTVQQRRAAPLCL